MEDEMGHHGTKRTNETNPHIPRRERKLIRDTYKSVLFTAQ
jgi:hypothetical protein